jgi:hypothetical protein
VAFGLSWRSPALTIAELPELPIDRNPLTKKPTSETWEQGIVMSRAEQTRNRMPNVTLSQAEAVAKAAIQRGKEPMDAGFWYHQPVGGRAVSAAPSTRRRSVSAHCKERPLWG